MNRPNTRGLLGKPLSAPVITAVFGPFIPGTCICSHNYSIMYQKSNVREGNIRKSGALGGESSLTGGCSGHCTWRGPGRGQGQGFKEKTPRAGPLTGAGRGIRAGAAGFGAPEAP